MAADNATDDSISILLLEHSDRQQPPDKVKRGRLTSGERCIIHQHPRTPTRPLNLKIPLRPCRSALRVQNNHAPEQDQHRQTRADPQEPLVRRLRLREFGQQCHDADFGEAEGEDAGAEGRDGPFDRVGLLVWVQGVEVPAAAIGDGDGGDDDVSYAADLVAAQIPSVWLSLGLTRSCAGWMSVWKGRAVLTMEMPMR